MTDKITFEKATVTHKEIIFSWLVEPHVQEFWDNTQGHKDDILNFMGGRKQPSNYCDGKYIYWIAYANGQPYAMLMTIQATIKDDIGELRLSHLSKTGHTYGLDYMIGSTEHIRKGYGAKTLIEFIDFFRDSFDKKADTFLIDPASDNPRAKRVYEKAGFKHVADFVMGGDCSGVGKPHHLLIKQFPPIVTLVTASIDDYPLIQNMARFFVYDMSKECGHISDEWRLPPDGLYESFDFKSYFEDKSRRSYLIKVYDEVAGFVLLNKVTTEEKNDWNMGEFFILGKFQGEGVGKQVANQVWKDYPGLWEVSVIPENKSALKFWGNVIEIFTGDNFTKETKIIDQNKDQPKRIIFTFDTHTESSAQSFDKFAIVPTQISDIEAINKLSYQKRRSYEEAQPTFWKWAGEFGEQVQRDWFIGLQKSENHICLTAKISSGKVIGFVIGKIISSPEVYDPGGLTLMVDDFCVLHNSWATVGNALLSEIKSIAKKRDVSQLVVVSGDHDTAKILFLKKSGLSIASNWFVGDIV